MTVLLRKQIQIHIDFLHWKNKIFKVGVHKGAPAVGFHVPEHTSKHLFGEPKLPVHTYCSTLLIWHVSWKVQGKVSPGWDAISTIYAPANCWNGNYWLTNWLFWLLKFDCIPKTVKLTVRVKIEMVRAGAIAGTALNT